MSISEHFPSLSDRQRDQLAALAQAWREWNEKINVVSRRDIDNLEERHLLHSLAIAKCLGAPVAGTTFLDLGTGGGLPGLPLAVVWPQCRFHLIDRVGKKIRVAQEAAKAAGLDNVTFQHGDIGECHSRYDFVVSRAVMELGALVGLVRKNIAREQRNALPNGLVCLKGGDLRQELAAVRSNPGVMVEEISTWFPEPFFETKQVVYVPL